MKFGQVCDERARAGPTVRAMRRVLLLATTVAALAAAPTAFAAYEKPEIPVIICGPTQMCHYEPPEIPPVLP